MNGMSQEEVSEQISTLLQRPGMVAKQQQQGGTLLTFEVELL